MLRFDSIEFNNKRVHNILNDLTNEDSLLYEPTEEIIQKEKDMPRRKELNFASCPGKNCGYDFKVPADISKPVQCSLCYQMFKIEHSGTEFKTTMLHDVKQVQKNYV